MVDSIKGVGIGSVQTLERTTAEAAVDAGAAVQAQGAEGLGRPVVGLLEQLDPGRFPTIDDFATAFVSASLRQRFAGIGAAELERLAQTMQQQLREDPLFAARIGQLWSSVRSA